MKIQHSFALEKINLQQKLIFLLQNVCWYFQNAYICPEQLDKDFQNEPESITHSCEHYYSRGWATQE